jgi:hypothetical protein
MTILANEDNSFLTIKFDNESKWYITYIINIFKNNFS